MILGMIDWTAHYDGTLRAAEGQVSDDNGKKYITKEDGELSIYFKFRDSYS